MPPPPPPVPFRLFRLASREPSRVRRRATNVRRLDSAAQPCSVALRARYVEVLDELRREWFGTSCLLSSSTPVAGEVLWASSHCSMALRS